LNYKKIEKEKRSNNKNPVEGIDNTGFIGEEV